MSASRRSGLAAAAGGGLALSQIARSTAASAQPHGDPAVNDAVAELTRRSAKSNAALIRGDIDGYRALIACTDDFTLMSPFGGTLTRARDYTDERMEAMGRFFKNGVFEQELVQSYGSVDMVLAIIERQNVEVGGLPAQHWPLRVTLGVSPRRRRMAAGAPARRPSRQGRQFGAGGRARTRRSYLMFTCRMCQPTSSIVRGRRESRRYYEPLPQSARRISYGRLVARWSVRTVGSVQR